MDLNKTFSAVQYASRKLLALNDEKRLTRYYWPLQMQPRKGQTLFLPRTGKTWTAWTSLIRSTTA